MCALAMLPQDNQNINLIQDSYIFLSFITSYIIKLGFSFIPVLHPAMPQHTSVPDSATASCLFHASGWSSTHQSKCSQKGSYQEQMLLQGNSNTTPDEEIYSLDAYHLSPHPSLLFLTQSPLYQEFFSSL